MTSAAYRVLRARYWRDRKLAFKVHGRAQGKSQHEVPRPRQWLRHKQEVNRLWAE